MVGEIRAPGYLEGGDFFPAGRDLALVGIGLRSNFEAARQLMDGDLLGTSRLAVVRDDFEQHQVGGCRVTRVDGRVTVFSYNRLFARQLMKSEWLTGKPAAWPLCGTTISSSRWAGVGPEGSE